jgi:hypothetical protein
MLLWGSQLLLRQTAEEVRMWHNQLNTKRVYCRPCSVACGGTQALYFFGVHAGPAASSYLLSSLQQGS